MSVTFIRESVVSLKPFLPLLAALALSGCAIGDRSMQTPHKIQVAGDTAVVPGCPDWSDGEVNSGEGQSTNYGCATRLNLAAMIADPADLVHGQVATATDAIATVRAIKAYREQIPTGTKELEKVKASGGGQ
jgi:type IV pilus biogenesis protein CpaD/CtpE